MSDKLNAADIARQMDHVNSASDANNVANELRQAIGGMSSADALTFVRDINGRTANVPGQGETLNILNDFMRTSIELNNPFTPQERIDISSGFGQPGKKPDLGAEGRGGLDGGIAPPMDLHKANGLDAHDTVDYFYHASRANPQNKGVPVAKVEREISETPITFTSPY